MIWLLVTYCCLVTAATFTSSYADRPKRLEIIGGKPTNILKHPYQVTVMTDCSGAILSNRWILTLAECVIPYDSHIYNYSIRAGSNSHFSGGKMYQLEQAVVHSKYDMVTHVYNFCLLKTSKPIKFNKKVKKIKYATKPLTTGNKGVASGWGQHEKINQTYGFRDITLYILDFTRCQKLYSGHVTDTMMCATSKNSNEGPCLWDWADPFVSRNTLYGLYSTWLIECPSAEFPSVFYDVTSVAGWIKETIATK